MSPRFVLPGIAILVGVIVALVMLPGDADAPASSVATPPGGAIQAAGVEASESVVDLGHVPLDTVVTPSFTLKNVGLSRALIDTPKIKLLEGC